MLVAAIAAAVVAVQLASAFHPSQPRTNLFVPSRPRLALEATRALAAEKGSPRPRSFSKNHTSTSSCSTVYYSRTFSRYVVCTEAGEVCKSYCWLDELQAEFPDSRIQPLFLPTELLESCAKEHLVSGLSIGILDYPTTTEPLFPPMGNLSALTIHQKIQSMVDTTPELQACLSQFDESDLPWIEQRILFLTSPAVPRVDDYRNEDWALMFANGYGAGLSVEQVQKVVAFLPQLLALHPDQRKTLGTKAVFSSGKPFDDDIIEVRRELSDWIIGSSTGDAFAMATLFSYGATWHQCSIILGAFSTSILTIESIPDLRLQKFGKVATQLKEDALLFLQHRFYLTPTEVYNMIQAWPPLSWKSRNALENNCNFLRQSLNLKSGQLKSLIVKTPRLLCAKTETLHEKIEFLKAYLKMSAAELQHLVVKSPGSVLCAIESHLKPKLDYYNKNLGFSTDRIKKTIVSDPKFLQYSLKRKIEPTIDFLCTTFNITKQDAGDLLARGHMWSFQFRSSFRPSIQYMQERLNLSMADCKEIVLTTPRVLSLSHRLRNRIDILELRLGSIDRVREEILRTPSLILLESSKLQALEGEPGTLKRVGRGGWCKKVFQVSLNGTVVKTFPNVATASLETGLSKSYLYTTIRLGKVFRQKYRFVYDLSSLPFKIVGEKKVRPRHIKKARTVLQLGLDGSVLDTFQNVTVAARYVNTSEDYLYKVLQKGSVYKRKYRFAYGQVPAADDLGSGGSSWKTYLNLNRQKYGERHDRIPLWLDTAREHNDSTVYLSSVCTGMSPSRTRGGLAMFFPQVFGKSLEQAASSLMHFKTAYPATMDLGTDFSNGLVVTGFPFSRPSRTRCSLYVCRDALVVMADLLLQLQRNEELSGFLRDRRLSLDIYTDSTLVMDLVFNSSMLLEWGRHSDRRQFYEATNTTEADWTTPKSRSYYPDILHPLARVVWRLVNQILLVPASGKEPNVLKNQRLRLAKEIRVRFRHTSSIWREEGTPGCPLDSESVKLVQHFAREAANQLDMASSELLL